MKENYLVNETFYYTNIYICRKLIVNTKYERYLLIVETEKPQTNFFFVMWGNPRGYPAAIWKATG